MMHIKRSETRTRSSNNALMSRRRSDYREFTLVIVIVSRTARVATERETDFYRFFRSTSRNVLQLNSRLRSEIFPCVFFYFVYFDRINYRYSNSRNNSCFTRTVRGSIVTSNVIIHYFSFELRKFSKFQAVRGRVIKETVERVARILELREKDAVASPFVLRRVKNF